jgi:hypothetical protein
MPPLSQFAIAAFPFYSHFNSSFLPSKFGFSSKFIFETGSKQELAVVNWTSLPSPRAKCVVLESNAPLSDFGGRM